MRQSKLFTKTRKEAPKDEVAKNAQLLIRAGFVHKEMAGVYSYLPLGLRVLENIEHIIRQEMNAAGGQEILMTALQDRAIWEKTGRWSDAQVDAWFKTELKKGGELGLGFTHEEPIARAMVPFISSYKDLPQYPYQIQTKFRNEERAKAGLLRGREFLMKDLYSFSRDEEEHNEFYEKMKEVYMRIYERLGIGDRTYITISSGEPFSKYSYEFQTVCEAGEDTIYIDEQKKLAINAADYSDEILDDFDLDTFDTENEETSIEVGDIYTLGTKYSEAAGLMYKDEGGDAHPVFMGSYGISPTRLMGTLVELFADEKGIVWPETVAPFAVHVLCFAGEEGKGIHTEAEKLVSWLEKEGIEVLYDDREVSPGAKLAEADLIGIPWRVVISEKTVEAGKIEVKKRTDDEEQLMSKEDFLKLLTEK